MPIDIDTQAIVTAALRRHLEADHLDSDGDDGFFHLADVAPGKTVPIRDNAGPQDGQTVDRRRPGLVAAFARPDLRTPRARELTPDEIAGCLDRGEDPWADAEEQAAGREAKALDRRFPLLARAAAGLAAPASRDALAVPGGIVLIEATDETWFATLSKLVRDDILPALGDADPRLAGLDPAVDVTAPPNAHGSKQKRFAEGTFTALGRGETCILVGSMDHLPAEADLFIAARIALPPIDAAIVLAMLRASHSRTGLVAEEAIRDRLPLEADLARLPDLALLAAFRAPTTLAVAESLARFATRLPAPAGSAPPITLDDVVGLPARTRAPLEAVVADLRGWQQGTVAWEDVPASVLLFGPPGTGKTRLARAVAGELGCPVIETSYAEWQAEDAAHLGTTLKAMRASFDAARDAAPCVLFVDELDSFPTRQVSDHHNSRYDTKVVNGLLAEMNRLSGLEGVVFIGATNHPAAVDPAILRSGRLDTKIHVATPDRAGLAAILRFYLRGASIPEQVIASLANQLLGLSGADVETVVKRARSLARMSRTEMSGDHLRAAADAVAEPEDAARLRRIAVHEAGHAIAARALGMTVGRVTIGMSGGQTPTQGLPYMTPDNARDQLTVMLAGRAAEELVFGDVTSGGGQGPGSDLANATTLAAQMHHQWGFANTLARIPDSGVADILRLPARDRRAIEALIQAAATRATGLLRDREQELAALADRLVREREVDLGAERSEPKPERRGDGHHDTRRLGGHSEGAADLSA